MNDDEALYHDIKADLEAVSGPLFEFARQQIRQRGTFLPFGAALELGGDVSLKAAGTDQDMVSAVELLPILHDGLRADAARSTLLAVAVCEWVKITPAGGSQTDAIKVLVEHARGLTVAFYMPCRRPFLRNWRFGDVMVLVAEPEVRPWNTPGAT